MNRRALTALLFSAFLAGAAFARLPVVGLAETCPTNSLSEVGSAYANAVFAAGAVPCLLPATTNAEVLAAQVARLDLLVLCDGEDVEPARPGEKARHTLTKCNLRRDAWEFALLDAAVRRRLPVLGICRGSQVLNVRFSGALRQDIPSEGEGVGYPAIGVQFHPELLFMRQGRREFLPLFRGAFAGETAPMPAERTRKVVAIPDYCPTNGHVAAKLDVAEALELAGFVPIVIPHTPDDAMLEECLRDADALMVAGGIGPLQDYDKRCAFEKRCIRIALARRIPISGVCHGSQIINEYFGGKLEKTPQRLGGTGQVVVHCQPEPDPFVFHVADLEPDSRIARVLGSSRVLVNSAHGLRSFEMGRGLRVTARAEDGVVEALEHETLPVMAFQFHPERMTTDARFVELLRVSLSPL